MQPHLINGMAGHFLCGIQGNGFKSLQISILFGVENIMHTKFIFQLDVYFTIAMMYTSTTTCFVYKITLYNTND